MPKYISEVLLKRGIHSTYLGFRYLVYALQLCLQDEDYLPNVHKRLYPAVAECFHVSRESVEHCIRTAVAHCYYQGNSEFLHQIAKYPLKHRPSNGEFLDILYHYLLPREP